MKKFRVTVEETVVTETIVRSKSLKALTKEMLNDKLDVVLQRTFKKQGIEDVPLIIDEV